MTKLYLFILFVVMSLLSSAQISFYGNPEPISAINTSSGEVNIFLDKDGESLIFTRENYSENAGGISDPGDLWVTRRDTSGWSLATRLPLNDETYASPLGFSGNLFLYSKVWSYYNTYKSGVYAYDLDNPSREILIEIPFMKNKSSLQSGYLSSNGQYLLLSIENTSGYGVEDLFVSFLRNDGTWSPLKNLEHQVNSRFQEITPFLAEDNKTLIFASNGREGNGSFDLYMSTRLDDTWQHWSEPKNLGDQVNTSGAESSFVFNQGGQYAYFVSTQNSDGYGDIKRIRISADIEKNEEDFVAEITIPKLNISSTQKAVDLKFLNASNGDSVNARVLRLVEDEAGETTFDALSDSSYQYQLQVDEGEIWDLEIKAKGYLSEEVSIGWDELGESETRVINLEPLESGNTITLSNVLFYRGTANFIEGSQRELNLVFEMMEENPEVKIFLKGHTDNVGNPMMNTRLSQERVKAVQTYLVNNGIQDSRISGEGYGGSQPVYSNETEETRKLNRRVEFEIRRD